MNHKPDPWNEVKHRKAAIVLMWLSYVFVIAMIVAAVVLALPYLR